MRNVLPSPLHYNGPLFEAAERSRVRALPIAARRIARRYGLPSSTAVVVAQLAGFPVEAGR